MTTQLELQGIQLCFVNSHLAAHTDMTTKRNEVKPCHDVWLHMTMYHTWCW